MTKIVRKIHKSNLVRELALNKVDALELLREALANAKDHDAERVWVKTIRGVAAQREPDVFILNDGAGMREAELSAFWGVSTSVKPGQSIGYKGHGTKLYFASRRLHVATRCAGEAHWRLSTLEHPSESDADDVDEGPLPASHRVAKEIAATEIGDHCGVAILIEGCSFTDAPSRFLSRRAVESYCDWFTVVGDVRAGLFKRREDFHEAVATKNELYQSLRVNEVALRPMRVMLSINGEDSYRPLGQGPAKRDLELLQAWTDDRKNFAESPGLLALGHRFSDHHESQGGAKRVRDDLTSLCLLDPSTFGDDPEYAVVLRIEGHRRQRETYLEASWQGHTGEYNFDDRFGLWLCRDFVPATQQNDWLREAIDRAGQKKNRLGRYEIKTLRNWHVFVNHQGLTLTANRNSVSNLQDVKERVITLVAKRIEKVLEEDAFAEWLNNLQAAVARGQRDREVRQMGDRAERITKWFAGADGVEPATIAKLARLDVDESLRLPTPTNEQELFHLYAVMSGAFRVPLRVLEYNTREGIDAVAQVLDAALFASSLTTARVEFKNEIMANRTIDHYFDAIDAFVCWKVGLVGAIREGGDSTGQGTLRKRTPVTACGADTHEVEYVNAKGDKRVIPVLAVETLFAGKKKR